VTHRDVLDSESLSQQRNTLPASQLSTRGLVPAQNDKWQTSHQFDTHRRCNRKLPCHSAQMRVKPACLEVKHSSRSTLWHVPYNVQSYKLQVPART